MDDSEFEDDIKDLASKKLDEIEEEVDASEFLGGFPSTFEAEDTAEDEEVDANIFDGFEENEPEFSDDAEEILAGIDEDEEASVDDFADFIPEEEEEDPEGSEDEVDFDPDADPEIDPLDAMINEDEEDEYGEVAAGGSVLSGLLADKAKLAFWGGASVLVLGIGYFGVSTVLPTFTGGGSQPVASAPSPSFSAAQNTSQINGIPYYNQDGGSANIPGLPSAVSNTPKVQIPGVAPDVAPDANRPSFDLSSTNVGLDRMGTTPSFEVLDPVSEHTSSGEELVLENVSAPMASNAELSEVSKKIDQVLGKIETLESSFVTKTAVAKMIQEELKKLPDTSSYDGPSKEDVSDLQKALKDLSGRVSNLESQEVTPSASPSAELSDEQITAIKDLIDNEFSKVNQKVSGALEEHRKQLSNAGQEASKKVVAENNRLKAKVARQKRQIAAAKARGGAVVPPSKPHVFKQYRLAGISSSLAWVETSDGVSRYGVGQEIPGAGTLQEIRESGGQYVLITSKGVIAP